jgi:hypothetical protein
MRLRGVPKQYVIFLPTVLGTTLAAAWSGSRRVHGVLCLLWFAAMIAYMNFSSLEKLAGQ